MEAVGLTTTKAQFQPSPQRLAGWEQLCKSPPGCSKSRDWQLQSLPGLGVEGTDASLPSLPPALLGEPPTLIPSGSHWPCLVPIVSLPATVSGHPNPRPPTCGNRPLPLPFPQPAIRPWWGGGSLGVRVPNSLVDLPLTPLMSMMCHDTVPQCAFCLLFWGALALIIPTCILLGLAQTSRNPTVPFVWSASAPGEGHSMSGTVPGSSVPTSRPLWEVLGKSEPEKVCLPAGQNSLQKKIVPKATSRGC